MFDLRDMPTVISIPTMFTAEECEHIIKLGSKLNNKEDAAIVGKTNITSRKGTVSWMDPSAQNDLTTKIFKIVQHVNKYNWKFSLYGFLEPLQFSIYNVGDHYGWHKDLGSQKLSMRKLSFSIQLSDDNDYAGGNLMFLANKYTASKERGCIHIFPSYEAHQVSAVTQGTRHALVGWVSGKPFS